MEDITFYVLIISYILLTVKLHKLNASQRFLWSEGRKDGDHGGLVNKHVRYFRFWNSLVDRPNRQIWRIRRRPYQWPFYNSFYPPAIVLYLAAKISMSALKKGVVARVRNAPFLRTDRKYPSGDANTTCRFVQTKVRDDKSDLFLYRRDHGISQQKALIREICKVINIEIIIKIYIFKYSLIYRLGKLSRCFSKFLILILYQNKARNKLIFSF